MGSNLWTLKIFIYILFYCSLRVMEVVLSLLNMYYGLLN